MNRKGDKSLIVGLDIGTSKVVAIVGEYEPGEPIEVIGIGIFGLKDLLKHMFWWGRERWSRPAEAAASEAGTK